jgi:hypothetical protein
MRTLFDQYRHPENRLTHALVSCLHEDPALLKTFLRWLEIKPPSGRLDLVEQSLPGEPDDGDDEAELERRGLPDGWIYADDWSLLIESKVASAIENDQLQRHLRTAARRGFNDVRLLVLSTSDPTSALPPNCAHRCWPDVYCWALAEAPRHPWALHLARYMEVAERRMVDEAYLTEGSLTTFAGIPFNADNPYSYLEAKRLIKLLMSTLRADTSLADDLGADLDASGRGAITGSGQDSVWDFIPLTHADADAYFTKHPHLTMSIHRDRATPHLTIPNGLDSQLRRNLLGGGYAAFKVAIAAFVDAAQPLLDRDAGAVPVVTVQQRRYPTQRSAPIRDAMLEFDPRTALGGRGGIKMQEEWLQAAFAALANRQSNIQVAVGIAFSYARSTSVGAAGFASSVANAWQSTKPLLELVRPD